MAKLHAPFNFVPLNEEVYHPEWADQISLDIPFSDGLSGVINLTILSESSIFIRNGEAQDKDSDSKKQNPDYYFSQTPDGRYFIPATSIKGAIRSVLEIISFGKMTQIQNQAFGIRDLYNSFYKKKIVQSGKVRCGWLRKKGNRVEIDECDEVYRISMKEIADQLKIPELYKLITGDNFKGKEGDKNRSAKIKYDLVGGKPVYGMFKKNTDKYNKKMVSFGGNIKGKIVFTGQPGGRNERSGKGKLYEFVFTEHIKENHSNVSEYVFKEFETIHAHSSDYTDFWREKLYNEEDIPVFFTCDDNKEVDSIGLSYMYKYPAYNTILDGIPDELLDMAERDMAEAIFGFTDKEFDALKGRVQFTHAYVEKGKEILDQHKYTMTLSSPRPSYYPLYLGERDGKLQSWNSETIRLAGRKRYPIRNKLESNTGSAGTSFTIHPLAKGNKFYGCIRFHNLKPIELGALLNAIRLWNDKKYYHNIGQGKPLGFGKVIMKADISFLDSVDDKFTSETNFVELFQNKMKEKCKEWGKVWEEGRIISELKLMAQGIPSGMEDEFKYMRLKPEAGVNDFVDCKKDYSFDPKSDSDKADKDIIFGRFSQIIGEKEYPGKVLKARDVGTNKKRNNKEEKLAKKEAERKKEIERVLSLEQTAETICRLGIEKRLAEAYKLILENNELLEKQKIKGLFAKIENERAKAIEMAKDAAMLESENKFDEAIEKYEEAQTYGYNSYESEIATCKNKKELMEEQILIDEAKQLMQERKYKEAKEKFEAAKAFGRNDYKEQIELCNENLRQNIEAAIIEEAKNYRQQKMFDEAIAKYKEAEALGFNNYAAQISECEDEKKRANLDIKSLTLSSPAAYSNGLKRIYPNQNIPEEDMNEIATFLKDKVGNNKNWKDLKKWKDVPKHIGKGNSDKLYALIFG